MRPQAPPIASLGSSDITQTANTFRQGQRRACACSQSSVPLPGPQKDAEAPSPSTGAPLLPTALLPLGHTTTESLGLGNDVAAGLRAPRGSAGSAPRAPQTAYRQSSCTQGWGACTGTAAPAVGAPLARHKQAGESFHGQKTLTRRLREDQAGEPGVRDSAPLPSTHCHPMGRRGEGTRGRAEERSHLP